MNRCCAASVPIPGRISETSNQANLWVDLSTPAQSRVKIENQNGYFFSFSLEAAFSFPAGAASAASPSALLLGNHFRPCGASATAAGSSSTAGTEPTRQ
jgi:hypothetical protein